MASCPPEDVLDRRFRVTTPLRTWFDIASGHLDVEHLATVITDALETGLITRRQLLVRADFFDEHAALRIERASQLAEAER